MSMNMRLWSVKHHWYHKLVNTRKYKNVSHRFVQFIKKSFYVNEICSYVGLIAIWEGLVARNITPYE